MAAAKSATNAWSFRKTMPPMTMTMPISSRKKGSMGWGGGESDGRAGRGGGESVGNRGGGKTRGCGARNPRRDFGQMQINGLRARAVGASSAPSLTHEIVRLYSLRGTAFGGAATGWAADATSPLKPAERNTPFRGDAECDAGEKGARGQREGAGKTGRQERRRENAGRRGRPPCRDHRRGNAGQKCARQKRPQPRARRAADERVSITASPRWRRVRTRRSRKRSPSIRTG
jgi:hypothetical protein